MRLLATAVGLSVLGSLGGLLLASSLLLFKTDVRDRLVPWLISYAVGTLLGVALLSLVPEALASLQSPRVLGTLLAGIVTFFVLEKLVIWRHCHIDGCVVHHGAAAPLILIGGGVHTFADGAIIAAAVMTSVPLGLSTALAVIAHEIPHEVSDFAILLGAGYSRRKALGRNLVSGATGVIGALLMFGAAGLLPTALPYVLSFAAGNFLYVAMSDLIPDLHRGPGEAGAARQIVLMALGIGTVLLL